MRDMTAEHDEDPEALAGEEVEYDWDDDPDKEVNDGSANESAGKPTE